jgi:DNA-binding transcriptional ArsR family regulator
MPSERPLDLVSFAWSPLFEAVLSLKAINWPKREPMHLPWARRCRDLPSDLLDEIHTLTRPWESFVPGIFEVGLLGDSPTFADELAAFRALDDELIGFELSLGFGGMGCSWDDPSGSGIIEDPEYRTQVLEAADASGYGDLARVAFDDPARLRERIADLMERYWEEAFADEWERIRPRIETDVTDGARALVTRGIPGLTEELLPEGKWSADDTSIVVEKKYGGDVDVAERGGMLFVPTVYGWPNVLIELARPWPVAIFFPIRAMREPDQVLTSDHEVADGLRALGDETRLQITRMVAEQPRSTKELAELLRLSDSAVSRHLRILAGAGVVEGERDGYFVLYRLKPDRIGQLGGALRRTLGLAQTAGTSMLSLPVNVAREREMA